MQPIKIYNGTPGTGPNPWKALIVLRELDLPYAIEWMPYASLKSEPYTTSLNPNGRFPAMVDPNPVGGGVTLFESGAIIQYLVATYDNADHKLSYDDTTRKQDRWLVDSWLMFQMSGQGPMFGQKMWFTHFHAEAGLTSAVARYGDETRRIVGVVEAQLRRQRETWQGQAGSSGSDDSVWLVGDKCTYADLAFVPWNVLLMGGSLFPPSDSTDAAEFDAERDYPEFCRWHANLLARPAVREMLELRDEAIRTMPDSAREVLPARNLNAR